VQCWRGRQEKMAADEGGGRGGGRGEAEGLCAESHLNPFLINSL